MQADFDIVGNVNPAQANAELCNLISSTLSDCGLYKDQFTINVSNRKIVQGLIDELKISEEKQIKVIRAIDKLDKPGFGLKGVEELLKKERKDQSGAVTKGAELSDNQAAQMLNFLKIKDLKVLRETLKNFKRLKVHVIGDTIIDSHTKTNLIGGYLKTPTPSVLYQETKDYTGGAAIVAKHLKKTGAKVCFTTILGDDKLKDFVIEEMKKSKIKLNYIVDKTRPTTNKNTSLKVNNCNI